MLELRVLSGLQQGAALPLVDGEWRIGAADDADLALYDPGVQARHALLQGEGQHWTLVTLAGAALHDADGCPQVQLTLLPDVPFALAGIWLCLAVAGSDWPITDPVPSALPLADAPQAPRSFWTKRVAISTVVVTLASGVWAFSTYATACLSHTRSVVALRQLGQRQAPVGNAQNTPFAVQQWLRDRELAAGIAFGTSAQGVTLDGKLAPQRLAAVRQALEHFKTQQGGSPALVDQLTTIDDQLPFQIAQIVGGKQGHVVTDDGRRLFLGDQVDGLRLTAIDAGKVVFDGDQRFEVSW